MKGVQATEGKLGKAPKLNATLVKGKTHYVCTNSGSSAADVRVEVKYPRGD